jgi:hypothetical protein
MVIILLFPLQIISIRFHFAQISPIFMIFMIHLSSTRLLIILIRRPNQLIRITLLLFLLLPFIALFYIDLVRFLELE